MAVPIPPMGISSHMLRELDISQPQGIWRLVILNQKKGNERNWVFTWWDKLREQVPLDEFTYGHL